MNCSTCRRQEAQSSFKNWTGDSGKNVQHFCYDICAAPMETLVIDFTVLEPSMDGLKNVLIVTDIFTKYSWTIPTKDQRAVTVAICLVKYVFLPYGCPPAYPFWLWLQFWIIASQWAVRHVRSPEEQNHTVLSRWQRAVWEVQSNLSEYAGSFPWSEETAMDSVLTWDGVRLQFHGHDILMYGRMNRIS